MKSFKIVIQGPTKSLLVIVDIQATSFPDAVQIAEATARLFREQAGCEDAQITKISEEKKS